MLGIEFKGILPGDECEVELKTRGIVESANVGTYTEVTLANLELTGKKGGNYKVDLDGEAKIKLSEPVEIWKKTPKEAPVTCTHTISPTDGTKFLCTVEVPLDDDLTMVLITYSQWTAVKNWKQAERSSKKKTAKKLFNIPLTVLNQELNIPSMFGQKQRIM